MKTRTLLMLAQGFPPRQAAATFRPLRFARFLPEFGWRCVVATPLVECHTDVDTTLMARIHPDTEVYRYPCCDPAEHLRRWMDLRRDRLGRMTYLPAKIVSRFLDLILLPDSRILSVRSILRVCERIRRERPFDGVWITGPPFSYFRAAPELKRRFSVPIVLDLRDPWTTTMLRYEGRFRWRLGIERRMEREVFGLADRVILNSQSSCREYRALYPDLPEDRFDVLTNGYDPADFVGIEPESFERMTLVHGGRSGGVRTARWLIEAMGRLRREGLITPASFRYVSYGPGGPEEHEAAFANGVTEMIEFRGSASHRDVLSAIMGANAVLLMVGKGHEASIPGKLYEYLGAGRSVIMAGAPDCAAADVIRQTGVGAAVAPDDVDGLAASLRDLMAGRLADHRDEEVIRSYESRSISRRLADTLSSLVDGDTH